MTKYDDKELVAGVLRGSAAHQDALYHQYSVPMFRVCLRYAKDRPEAEDMLQDGFVRVFRDMQQFRGDGALGGWIRRIMINSALTHLRRKKDIVFSTDDFSPIETHHVTEDNPYAKLDVERLLGLLQELPAGYRTVFNLYAIEGFSHEEIAEQLGCTTGTSKSQLFKARDYLKKILKKHKIERNDWIER